MPGRCDRFCPAAPANSHRLTGGNLNAAHSSPCSGMRLRILLIRRRLMHHRSALMRAETRLHLIAPNKQGALPVRRQHACCAAAVIVFITPCIAHATSLCCHPGSYFDRASAAFRAAAGSAAPPLQALRFKTYRNNPLSAHRTDWPRCASRHHIRSPRCPSPRSPCRRPA